MAIQVIASGSPVTGDSLVIPVSNLSGFNTLVKFQDALPNINNARVLISFVEKSLSIINATNFKKLGISASKTITSATVNTGSLLLFNYSFILQKYIEQDSAPVALPIPTTGSNLGLGDFDLITIFPNAAKVANGSNVAADAVAIAVTELLPYGSPAYASINLASGQDNRLLWMSIIQYLIDKAVTRVTGTSPILSSVTTKSLAVPTNPTVPANYVDATNPLTSIDSALLYGQAFITQQVLSLTTEMIYTASSLSVDVNNA